MPFLSIQNGQLSRLMLTSVTQNFTFSRSSQRSSYVGLFLTLVLSSTSAVMIRYVIFHLLSSPIPDFFSEILFTFCFGIFIPTIYLIDVQVVVFLKLRMKYLHTLTVKCEFRDEVASFFFLTHLDPESVREDIFLPFFFLLFSPLLFLPFFLSSTINYFSPGLLPSSNLGLTTLGLDRNLYLCKS